MWFWRSSAHFNIRFLNIVDYSDPQQPADNAHVWNVVHICIYIGLWLISAYASFMDMWRTINTVGFLSVHGRYNFAAQRTGPFVIAFIYIYWLLCTVREKLRAESRLLVSDIREFDSIRNFNAVQSDRVRTLMRDENGTKNGTPGQNELDRYFPRYGQIFERQYFILSPRKEIY